MNPPLRAQVAKLVVSSFSRLVPVIVVLVIAPFAASLGAEVAEVQRAKRVLLLFSEGKDVPGNVLVERGAREVLLHSRHAVEFYAEYLDAGRFPEENHYRLFREYLQAKYAYPASRPHWTKVP